MANNKKSGTKKTEVKKPEPEEMQPEVQQPEPVDDYVEFIIPRDPSLEDRCQLFEGCYNGHVFCYSRGETIRVPRARFEFISHLLEENEHISPEVAEFTNTSKRLNF